MIDPSHCILSETNRFPRSRSALASAGRLAAGPRVPQERRVRVEVEGKQGESSF